MAALSPLRVIAVLGLGLAAPHLWIESMFPWSWYVFTPLLKGLSASFGVKGPWIVYLSGFIHSIVVGSLFALALRGVAGFAWLTASAIFCVAFLVSLVGSFDPSISMLEALSLPFWFLAEVAFLFVCVVGAYGVLRRFPRSHGA